MSFRFGFGSAWARTLASKERGPGSRVRYEVIFLLMDGEAKVLLGEGKGIRYGRFIALRVRD